MKGTILYQCRICGHENIPIRKVVQSVFCPSCRREIPLIPSTVEYLKKFYQQEKEDKNP